jgi:hypothetical protein
MCASAFYSSARKGKKGGSGGNNNNEEPFKGMSPVMPAVIGLSLATMAFLSMTASDKM